MNILIDGIITCMKYLIFLILSGLFALTNINSGFEQNINYTRIILDIVLVIGVIAVLVWGRMEKKGMSYKPWYWTSIGAIILWLVLLFTLLPWK